MLPEHCVDPDGALLSPPALQHANALELPPVEEPTQCGRGGEGCDGRGRSRSPGRTRNGSRKQAHSVPAKNRASIMVSSAPSATANDASDAADSDNETPVSAAIDRHSRSSSMGNRRSKVPVKRLDFLRWLQISAILHLEAQ